MCRSGSAPCLLSTVCVGLAGSRRNVIFFLVAYLDILRVVLCVCVCGSESMGVFHVNMEVLSVVE